MKRMLFIITLMLVVSGCASERLFVKVVDNDGLPVSNAAVRVGFSTSHVLFGGGRGGKSNSEDVVGFTDKDGNAVVRFNCQSSDFYWRVEAEGYYQGITHREHFAFDEVFIPPVFFDVILHEHEKHGTDIVWKKRNPQPMLAHGVSYEKDQHLVPKTNGRYGFDLARFDWLPPLGKGEIADFVYVRRFGECPDDGVIGHLEFAGDDGFYVGRQTGNKTFPSVYAADTNAIFRTQIPFVFNHADDGKNGITYKDIVQDNEYAVLRTRTVCDSQGKVIQANYSKILGPFRFGSAYRGWVISTPCSVFNPRPNDPNLESDPQKCYDGKTKRPLLQP